MTVIPASHVGALPNAAEEAKKIRIVGEQTDLQKDMFLKLMIAQLRNQDPTAPMDQKDMMAAMTQFSQVEQMQNITKAMETLSLAQGVNMVGQYVDYRFVQTNEMGRILVDEVRTGRVAAVEQKDGSVQLTLENGVRVKPGDVSAVSETPALPQTRVGKYVTYAFRGTNPAGEAVNLTLTGRVSGVTQVDGRTMLLVGTRMVDPADLVTVSNIPLSGYQESPPLGVT